MVLLSAWIKTLAERESGRLRPVKRPLAARNAGKSEPDVVEPAHRRAVGAVPRPAVKAAGEPAAAPEPPD